MRIIIAATAAALALSTGTAEASHHHHHARAHGTVWNWNAPGFWQPIPGTFIAHRADRPRKHHAGAAVARHARVRVARHHHAPAKQSAPATVSEAGDGIVKSASGAVAYVAKAATAAFQCVVNELELAGYPIKEMGGFANRGHIRHSLHYSGLALDVNQVQRNITVPRMPANEIEIARGCGLISGAQWADGDSGHFQMGGWAGRKGATQVASHRHHRHYAYRRYRGETRVALYRRARISFMDISR